MPQSIDTLIEARWIVPVEPDEVVLEDHAIAIDQGRIVTIETSIQAREQYSPQQIITLDQHVLTPGLINTHTHAAMTLFRGLADDLPLMEWLNKHIWPAEQHWGNESFVRSGTQLAIVEMLKSGTTCFNDMYYFPDVAAKAAQDYGIRAVIGLLMIEFPTPWAQSAEEYIRKGISVHDQVRNSELVSAAFAPHAPYTVSDGSLKKIQTLADELDIPIHMHVHETAHEIEESVKQHRVRPLERLSQLGLLTPRLLCVHMTQLLDSEIQVVAEHGVHVVHCPESNLKLASGTCPVQNLLDQGINVALGTDGAASNNDLDMLGELRSAALLAKGYSANPMAVPAHQALSMATINAARALGLDQHIGSLLPGKAADIIAIDLAHPSTQPVYDPIAQLVYSAGRDQVTDVWVNGRHTIKNRQHVDADIGGLLEEITELGIQIHQYDVQQST
ncbi:MAG: TRZ/ATZ family hydrolase [Arenicellales bacterium]|nr:TRZ/ATZ family hydrolase [Arenicellales bacterium]